MLFVRDDGHSTINVDQIVYIHLDKNRADELYKYKVELTNPNSPYPLLSEEELDRLHLQARALKKRKPRKQ